MSKIKKCFNLINALLITITSFFGVEMVKADTYNDTVYIDYSYSFAVATTKYADHNYWLYADENPIRRSSDNQLIYCLEAHVPITDGAGVVGYDDEGSYSRLTNISFTDMQRIMDIAYYGYGYGNHTSMDWYAATQIMIWQITNRTDSPPYPVETGDRSLTRSSKYDAMFNEINYLVDHDYLTVSFNGQDINANVGQTITLTDTNEVLSRFFNVDVNGSDLDVSINGNDLVIKSNSAQSSTINLIPKSNIKPVIYDGANQKVISRGDPRKVQASVKINFKGGDVEGYKKDADTNSNKPQGGATLKGAIYEVYDATNDKLVTTLTTDENGKIKSDSILAIGKYYLKEKTASVGYQLDKTKYYFEISSSNLHPTLTLYEKVINMNFDYTKVYASDKTGIMTPEVGVKFAIYDNSGKLVKELTTDSQGNFKFNLPYGTYTVKQLTSTKNYEKVKDFKIVVKTIGDTVKKVISNADITAKLRVVKIDEETKEVIKISGIKFKIFNVSTNEYVCQTITYPTRKTICEFETDENGEFTTPYELKAGTYYLEEVDQKIDGYLWNDKSHEFTIDENANLITDSVYGIVFDTKFSNKRVEGKIEVKKTGEVANLTKNGFEFINKPLKGVTFGLYAYEDIISNGKIIYKKDTKIGEKITDNDGNIVFDNLYLGKYYLKEIKTLDNYVLDKNKYVIEVNYKDQYTPVVVYSKFILNILKTGKLEFTKTDFSESKALPNTLIEIYTKNDKLVFSGRTDKNGKIVIQRLPQGKYYILEKEAPVGYKLNEEKMWFEIKENGEIVKATMKDEDITGTLEFSKLDFSTDEPLPNTLIQIYNENDELVFEGRTNENGMITIEKLKYGKYYFLEKEAPVGYKLNEEKMWFEIKEDGKIVKATMKDEKIIEVPDTYKNDYKEGLIGGISLIILGTGVLAYDKKKKD